MNDEANNMVSEGRDPQVLNESGTRETRPSVPSVPVAAISAARKELTTQVKSVVAAAQELEQLALYDEVPFEEAFCLSPEEVAKRYTAENARQIEWRRKACVELLARQCPSEDIAHILSMNHRTVAAIAAQEGQKIATTANGIADVLANSAMADIALADTKKHGATYKDLHIGAGIKLTHHTNLKLVGASGGDAAAVEVEVENPALTEARKWLAAHGTAAIRQQQLVPHHGQQKLK
jgi:hypothetical protein